MYRAGGAVVLGMANVLHLPLRLFLYAVERLPQRRFGCLLGSSMTGWWRADRELLCILADIQGCLSVSYRIISYQICSCDCSEKSRGVVARRTELR